jgi:hypothetical protein
MLARSPLRTLSRRILPFPVSISRASISSTVNNRDPGILDSSHGTGQRKQQEIAIARFAAQATSPVTPPGGDLQRTAEPLESSIYPKLTYTLSKFTLRDKVAVVTGYDDHYNQQSSSTNHLMQRGPRSWFQHGTSICRSWCPWHRDIGRSERDRGPSCKRPQRSNWD